MKTEWLNPEEIDGRNEEQRLLLLRHQKAYDLAQKYCEDKRVLEIGCSAGYGTKRVSHVAVEVIGVDLDPKALEHAKKGNTASNIKYLCGNPIMGLPFEDGCQK